MAAGGLTGTGNDSSASRTTPPSPSSTGSTFSVSSKSTRQAQADGKKPGGKPEQRTSGGGQSNSVGEQNQKLQEFDAFKGRPPLGGKQTNDTLSLQAGGNEAGHTRSAADMRARVQAYQQDYNQTLNNKIKSVDTEIAGIDRQLERMPSNLGNTRVRQRLQKNKEALLQERAGLQELADTPAAERETKFEAYQRRFDQEVHTKIADVDQKIADINRQLDQMKPGGRGEAMRRHGLMNQKKQLLEQRANLQEIADTPEAALEALKARQAQQDGSWTASDIGHLALDVIGMAPVVGEWADVLNGLWYFAEGRKAEGTASMASAIPGLGNAATAGKWAAKAADAGGGVGKSADNVAAAAKGPDAPGAKSGGADPAAGSGTPKPSAAERRRAQKEAAHQREIDAQIQKGIKRADAHMDGQLRKARAAGNDAAVESLEAQKKWLDETPRHRELAYDPDKGTYSIDEAMSALRAEKQGLVKGPLKRDIDVNGGSSGGDFIDADGKVWDHKFTSGSDADKLIGQAKRGENLVVDLTRIDPEKRAGFLEELREKIGRLSPDAGDIKVLE